MAGATGWAIREHDGSVTTGVTLFLETKRAGDRWLRLISFLRRSKPDRVIYELPIIHFKNRNGLGLGHAFEAIVQFYCAREKIPCSGVPISTLKKWATGDGRADKFKMHLFAQSMKWDITDDNEVDARWLLHYAIERIEKGERT